MDSTVDPNADPEDGLDFFEVNPGRWELSACGSSPEPKTRLELTVTEHLVEIVAIHVHPSERGRHVALRMVKRVAYRFPNRHIKFTAMNGLSRKLARRCAEDIPMFDPGMEVQQATEAADHAEGLYGERHIDVREWETKHGTPVWLYPDAALAGRGRWRLPWRRQKS